MPPRLNHLLTPLSLFRSSNPCSSAAAASPFSTTTRNRDVAGRAVRTARASAFAPKSYPLSMQQRRMNSTKEGGPGAEQQGEPGQDQLQSVSEEAADIAKIKAKKAGACGDVGAPEWEHGTPVEDILKRDKDAMKNAPKIMRDEIAARKGTRSYSTSARLSQGHLEPSSFDLTKDGGLPKDDPSVTTVAQMLENATPDEATREELGYKFDVPEQLPRSEHLRFRYDPVVDQFTKLIMKDGKLSLAQRNMNLILDHLRTSPPPKIDSTRPLLPGPPAPQLPLNPILYLTLIIDSVAPLLRIRQQRGAAGGGASLPIPIPLRVRQRRRAALQWIIAASEKRRDTRLAVRLANELVAVAEGRSSVWEHRAAIHKLGVSARTNVNWSPAQRGRK
ncbi:hypothetical protein AJ80_03786 [Polytolypa hystricis UAMH7299]|uniref:Small ribosomal subunit protein uS7m n=1 Tax=Polytolypa hystricis (strain UAMH7299) TaxID=1447883 RepID=A0A2B7YFL4_POLH7|nr:hypothetical protein AJ80_03786 [Polytolypa hystricis UAMH7299]